MNKILLATLLLIPASWSKISEKNAAIDLAAEKYKVAEYEESVRQHLALLNEHGITAPEANFDLALSYQFNGQEEEAKKKYLEMTGAAKHHIASAAANQNGVLLGRDKKYEEALAAFKTALIKDPTNETARYNYELLARWLDKNQDQQDQENQDDNKQEPSNYAKRMKAEADKLVDQFKFQEALDVMAKALEIDETVSHYQEFIKNLGDINEINAN
ncbi:hypothetical protein [Echinicola vietnamensis]|uniref:Uncharacterized protein n=1 Tax=Echinicola vietnamensis (strain DSM 17526 / LMG 23754 / KMM 6221) TaxID=926556 RepID=L0G509_ECHVK|nr:hypothetical protein [Echinicola vietnamensis]AGA79915.1 hypothetical protein Echvi_3703 [Echinicola vietnamensis DSM 17526]